ncbi:putative Rossmann-fold nucleotide-binding protein [Crossiella equi]|uniref:Rossmann-fold nucleotide-binding protein n=1 Tax=Crossiella equi TaxID=130796 RepID=A0ABS5AI65_9PSEU|nr:hypothetical protein [Crossiella equi]MBP2475967.1 putative Rossmann-fold nucleotide-binding protein [Crossiella equi]
MRIEISELEELREHRAAGRDLRHTVLVGLDLTGAAENELLRTSLDGALLLGCRLTPSAHDRAEASGALVFPDIPELPYRAYRSTLYTVAELFEGLDARHPETYADTLDSRVYRHSRSVGGTGGNHPDPQHALAERLHDHAITEALEDLLATCAVRGRANPVAVMGGHAFRRDSAEYRAAAELGRAIGRSPAGFTVLTGGGPGAMEAIPLGVRLADEDDDRLTKALSELAAAPAFHTSTAPGANSSTVDDATIGHWVTAGLSLGLPEPADLPRTIGIPTWFYGHEPPNPLCEVHAKYFANSVREDGLLTVATGGVLYTPGRAGTVQEIFQDLTQNYYESLGPAAPMVFLGRHFWTEELPVADLVHRLAAGRALERWILFTDDPAEAVALLEDYAGQG